MKSLYAPWRSSYSQDEERSSHTGSSEEDCPFCIQIAAHEDEKYFILRRFKDHYVVFNKFPYNSGHLLVIPYQHVATIDKLSTQARSENIELVTASMAILQDVMKAHGFNVGINMGKAAGAGLPSHLHTHLLPRWYGDTSFLPTISDTKAVSIDLHELYKNLKPHFEAMVI